MKRVIVTGGAGFIGSALVRRMIAGGGYSVLNLDKLTYAGNLHSLREVAHSSRYRFAQADIADAPGLQRILAEFRPHAIVHLAAESHVDRSIEGPETFLHTNVIGTCTLLSETLRYWETLDGAAADAFRFHHVSTDEVFGELGPAGRFTESSRYMPNSPYAASKAAADHFVRAWGRTYGLPVVMSNCSNNYGPCQFPEKLIPLVIIRCLRDNSIPVYGEGEQVRDWLYVDDHVEALQLILEGGQPGESYNIGGASECRNIDIVHRLCDLLDHYHPRRAGRHCDLIRFVEDRPGHDFRYAIDFAKLQRTLGWRPRETLASGLERTVRWYLANGWWWEPLLEQHHPGERLGLVANRHVAV